MKTEIDVSDFNPEKLIRDINSRVELDYNEQLERQYADLDTVNKYVVDYYKDFVKGVTSDDLPQLQGYTKQGIQRKLNILCKVDRKQIDGNRVRIYTLKDKTQNPDLWNIIEYIHYGESEEDKEEE